MVDKSENILVEFDYNNITIVDPNKVIDSEGKIKDRSINQEDLVMYANLECKVLPRTKLALGVASNDQIRTISVATMNFLNPGNKGVLDNSYTDELTGKDTLTGKGTNQPKSESIKNPKNSDDYYIRQTINSNGIPGAIDNGLLGITQINIRQGLDFLPTITMELEDIKGRALFEAGNNSPYAAFFNLPYPLFHLTIKGYLGKAVKLSLMLNNFTSRYDTNSGNFKITLKFYTYKYTILNEISMGALKATPHMYTSRVNIQPVQGGPAKYQKIDNSPVELGYEKIKEMYSEYKSKGLIPDDFPEITLNQLRYRLETFVRDIMDNFSKQNMGPLTDVENYSKKLIEYEKEVFYTMDAITPSWFHKYMDEKDYFVLNDKNKTKIYTWKANLSEQNKSDGFSELDGLLLKYNTELNSNPSVGDNGTYVIDNQTYHSKIPNTITGATFWQKIDLKDIDYAETYRQRKKVSEANSFDIEAFKAECQSKKLFNALSVTNRNGQQDIVYDYFKFDGADDTFISLTNKMAKLLEDISQQIQSELTKSLSKLLLNKGNNGLGFIPNIRNVLAVVFANGEAFLRLMDDIHTKAWNQRDSDIRKAAIFDKVVSNASADNLTPGDTTTQPVYPWPQFIVETDGEDGKGKFELRYPGESAVLSKTKGYLYDVWPEIEFVEEFIKGFTYKDDKSTQPKINSNELTDVQRVSVAAIEFPVGNFVYYNKEEVKYFYEIYERVFLTSNYARLVRSTTPTGEVGVLTGVVSEVESLNIINSLSTECPFIIQKLKEYNLNGNNFELILRHFSNDGNGVSWQNYERGIFNTTYIKNYVNNGSFEFIKESALTDVKSNPITSLKNEDKLVEYVQNSKTSNTYDLLDIYPFTNFDWLKKYLSNGTSISDAKSAFNTSNILTYNTNSKVISNYLDGGGENSKKPFTNFLFKNIVTPTEYQIDLKSFYSSRTFDSQLPTEGNLRYSNYVGEVSANQTVSMLNTPYFINSIQEGVQNFRLGEPYPFVAAAYLFINSLPLSTLKEKYKTCNDSTPTDSSAKDLDYIFATLKKFGAIHKIPFSFMLKIGSIWHRYKTYVEKKVDIINSSWSDFKYVENYDPVNNSKERVYPLTINGGNIDVVLEKDTTLGTETSTLINTGFYPKLINDFNVFYQGVEIYSGYTDSDIQSGFDNGVTMNYVDDAIIDLGEGFDKNNVKRDLRVIPWSVYVNTPDKLWSYIFPSQGSLINQTKDECFKKEGNNYTLVNEVKGNKSMYNGSVRLFWVAPNYGYFDNGRVVKSSPSQYLKQIFSDSPPTFVAPLSSQENFSINGTSAEYTQISEMFSIFEKTVLDSFETEFLNFSKSVYDYNSEDNSIKSLPSSKSYKNFQMLMRDIMKTPKITGDTNTTTIEYAQSQQLTNLANVLDGFLNYNIVFKYGNPSNFDKKLFYTFSRFPITDPYTWSLYTLVTPKALPSSGGGVSLATSKINYPNVWNALETYVGFSEIPELTYKDSGSYITDFFIDFNISFTIDNVIQFAPIIKIYATQKLSDKTINKGSFTKLMTDYLSSIDKFKSDTLTNLMLLLRKQLPDVSNSPEVILDSKLSGDQTKIEHWETFKAINDKWIAGGDFKTKTLFEDVLLLDRASRNIGEKIYVDVIKLKDRLTNINDKTSMYTFVSTILTENNFQIMNLPSYVNFYNVQDVSKNPRPKADGHLEFANTLFGTFMNVDYRESTAKLVCFYAGKSSEQLAIKNNVDYRFRDDAFDLTRQGDNPMAENLINKKDWDKSNKVVGFNVDIGPQNQSIFKSFQVAQNPGMATMESLAVETQMANLSNGRNGTTQNISLYNLYKNRSYTCTLFMLGNAMIQPTMYFNLRHVPMFNGPYMIQTVNHSISPGNFETVIEGVRQPTAELPKIENYIQVLKQTLLKSIVEKIQQLKDENAAAGTDVISQRNRVNLDSKGNDNYTPDLTPVCTPDKYYVQKKYIGITPDNNNVTFKEVVDIINSLTTSEKLRYTVFATLYIASSRTTGLEAYGNNFSNITINQFWGAALSTAHFESSGQGTYYCVVGKPFVVFDGLQSCIHMLIQRWSQRMGTIDSVTDEHIAKFWILNENTVTVRDLNVYDNYPTIPLENLKTTIRESFGVYNSTILGN